jgi:hypothetical protein
MDMSGQFYAPAALTPEKVFRYQLKRSIFGGSGEEKNLVRLPVI